jgi:uncharacterized protein YbjT (DUF2867 family)
MNGKTASLIGATGLIGNYLLEELLNDDYFDKVKILIRRPLEFTHPKLEKHLVNFNDHDSILIALNESDVVFCSIGTTQKKVKGDKEAYRKVDYDIAVNAARFSKMVGCETFVLVSSVGANSKSNNFYLKLKGEIEHAIESVGIDSVHIMRPSVLMGERNESRAGESISKKIMSALSFMIPSKYKPIHARDVAKAMLAVAKSKNEGFHIYQYAEMKTVLNA